MTREDPQVATADRTAPPADPPVTVVGVKKAFLATLREEFLTPVGVVIDLSEMLLQEPAIADQARFVDDLGKVYAAGKALLALVNEILAPPPAETPDAEPDLAVLQSRVRHDMLNCLNLVINYCEMWLEEAEEHFLQGFAADLQAIHKAGKDCCVLTDKILSARSSATPDTDLERLASLVRLPENHGAGAADTENGCLLVVDDNETNRDILCRRLRGQGHRVQAVASASEALAALKARRFDLLLLDIMMPGMNGLQLLGLLKADQALRDLPVIMISALNETESVARCIAMGADDYLPKPFNPLVLKARIGACLEKKRLRDREVLYLQQIEQEKKRSDDLLHVILPAKIVEELKATNAVKPRCHENVAVLFADIVGFTPYCDRHEPAEVLRDLQQLVGEWEETVLRHEVEKIKTMGDAIMAAAGLLKAVDNPVLRCVQCGLEMIAAARRVHSGWDLRVGIHAGPVVAGVLGHRQYLFDLWGDTVNTAARMESHGTAGAITLSADAWKQVADRCRGEFRGRVDVKGKGAMEIFRFAGFVP